MAFRRCFVALAIVVFAVVAIGCSGGTARGDAEAQVEMMLANMQSGRGTDGDIQTATCVWYANKILIADSNALGRASDGFDVWRIEKGLYQGIDSYEVLGSEFEGDPAAKVVIVKTMIDGKPYSMRVPKGKPVSWVE